MTPVILSEGRWFDAEQARKWVRETRDTTGYPEKRWTLWRTRLGGYVLQSDRFEPFAPDEEDWQQESIVEVDSATALVWLLSRNLDLPEDLAELKDELEV